MRTYGRVSKVSPIDPTLPSPAFDRNGSCRGQIAWRLGTLGVLDAAKTVALDVLDHGVLLLDVRGHVLFANRAAEAIIALRHGLTVVREGLRAALPADTARLQGLIADTRRGAAGGTMRLTRPSLAEPFVPWPEAAVGDCSVFRCC